MKMVISGVGASTTDAPHLIGPIFDGGNRLLTREVDSA